ncbi:MAG: M23 family metallopeptidase [Spirochaetaceae bacterium]|nr:MAG: M23 family metallopeptidase [Spirochaetaceae bacterium]
MRAVGESDRAVAVAPPSRAKTRWLVLLFLGVALSVRADSPYPLIERAHHADPLFRQHQDAVQEYYLRSRSGRPLPPLSVYRYVPLADDTLLTLAARFTLPYSTLASINRISTSTIPPGVPFVLIPSIPGIYVPEAPASDLEQLLAELRLADGMDGIPVSLHPSSGPTRFQLFVGDDFDRIERLSFLNILFRRPVENIRITSPYGYRLSPFGGGRAFHSGVDFAAPIGTTVRASREGQVTSVGFDPVFGYFVVISHHGGYETFYGHLDSISVQLNDVVASSMMIGTVGNSGLSTGPHLHFEIRLNGETRDPAQLMPGLHR